MIRLAGMLDLGTGLAGMLSRVLLAKINFCKLMYLVRCESLCRILVFPPLTGRDRLVSRAKNHDGACLPFVPLGEGSEDEGPNSKEEEEAAPEGQQQQVVQVVDTTIDEPLGLDTGRLDVVPLSRLRRKHLVHLGRDVLTLMRADENTIKLPVGNNSGTFFDPTGAIRWICIAQGCSSARERPRLPSEDPNQHLKDFLKLVDSLDLDGENRERTRLRLFQFSLRDQASNCLERLPTGSITTWEDLTTRFLAQFFPPGRTSKLHNDILMFQQHHGESLSEA
ncbi:zinc finger, CCHC-type containing protein [Tanacetum coccineum]